MFIATLNCSDIYQPEIRQSFILISLSSVHHHFSLSSRDRSPDSTSLAFKQRQIYFFQKKFFLFNVNITSTRTFCISAFQAILIK